MEIYRLGLNRIVNEGAVVTMKGEAGLVHPLLPILQKEEIVCALSPLSPVFDIYRNKTRGFCQLISGPEAR